MGSEASACRLLGPSILYGLGHTLQGSGPAVYTSCPKFRVPRATWKFPWSGLPDQVWVGEGGK